MMPLLHRAILAALTCLPVCGQFRAWTPYTAEFRDTIQVIDAQGNVAEEKITTGTEGRDREGNAFTITVRAGAPVSGQFTNGPEGKIFQLSYADKTATLVHQGSIPVEHTLRVRGEPSIGDSAVEGIHCEEFPIRLKSRTGPVIGRTCIDRADEIQLRRESLAPSPKGDKRARWVRELHDIKIGTAPDPEFLHIPAGFKTLGKEACSTCSMK